MKKAAFLAGLALLLSFSLMAQQPDTAKQPTVTIVEESKYKLLPMPAPLTIEKTFPVLGSYQLNAADGSTTKVSISLDETNKGIVWIDGLPEGRFKALLKKSPSTYKIPAQKTADEKSIAEGTLVYDKETNQMQICMGCKFNNEDPSQAFVAVAEPEVTSKKKSKTPKVKVITYTGVKEISIVTMQQ